MRSSYIIFQVRLGWMGLVGNDNGVERIYLPGLAKEELRKRIQREFPESQEGESILKGPKRELVEYFEGSRSCFEMPLDLSKATPFQKKSYQVM